MSSDARLFGKYVRSRSRPKSGQLQNPRHDDTDHVGININKQIKKIKKISTRKKSPTFDLKLANLLLKIISSRYGI